MKRLLPIAALALLWPATHGPYAQSSSPADSSAARRVSSSDTASTKPAPPTSPVSDLRNRISAGDLLSAESVLEVYARRAGEDSRYYDGLAWLARGALQLGEPAKAERYAADVRRYVGQRLTAGGHLTDDDYLLESALGAALEVQAQVTQRRKGASAAAADLRHEIAALPPEASVGLRARLNKRLNMLSLVGTPAPEIDVEDWIGARPPTLASLRGRPLLLFIWAEGCFESRAESATLANVVARHVSDSLRVFALSRYYNAPEKRPAEKARGDSIWKEFYTRVGDIPRVLSTASMVRYGGSSTPTFVFIDRAGVVRAYTPTRLTEPEFERRLVLIIAPSPSRARK